MNKGIQQGRIILSSTTVFKIHNNENCFLITRPAIGMISEGSCDTEDWSNDAENSALYIK